MTVSRALRNHPQCSKATKERINKLAEKLNYKKHPLVTALMSNLRYKKDRKFNSIIALLHFDDPKQPLHPNLVNMRHGIRENCEYQGYTVEEFYMLDPGMTPARMIQIFKARGIRGIIFEHSLRPNIELAVDLSGFACVGTKYSLTQPVFHRIETSQFASLLTVFEKLREDGFNRFGLVLPEGTETISQFRRSGATLHAQQEIKEEDRIPILTLIDEDKEQLQQWMESYQPEVVLSQSSKTYHLLIELDYKIPEDCGFVHLGLNNREGIFSGIDPNWTEIGRIASNQVIDQLNRNKIGVPEHPTVTLVQGDWVDGATLPRRNLVEAD